MFFVMFDGNAVVCETQIEAIELVERFLLLKVISEPPELIDRLLPPSLVIVPLHVSDHSDDIFYLIRVGNFFRKMVIHLSIGEVALFLTFGDQVFKT